MTQNTDEPDSSRESGETSATDGDSGRRELLPGRSWILIAVLGVVAALAVALVGVALLGTQSGDGNTSGDAVSTPQPTPTPAEPSAATTPVGQLILENKFQTPGTSESEQQDELEADVKKALPNSAVMISDEVLYGIDQKSPMVFAFDRDADSASAVAEAMVNGLPPGWSMSTSGTNCNPSSGVTPLSPERGNALLLVNRQESEFCVFGITSETMGDAQVIVVQGRGEIVDEKLVDVNGRDPVDGRAFIDVPPVGVIVYVAQSERQTMQETSAPAPMPEPASSEPS